MQRVIVETQGAVGLWNLEGRLSPHDLPAGRHEMVRIPNPIGKLSDWVKLPDRNLGISIAVLEVMTTASIIAVQAASQE